MSTLSVRSKYSGGDGFNRTSVEISGLGRFEPAEIWYEFTGPAAPRHAPNGNFAVAAVLPIAMASGRALHFDGNVDSDFLEAMESYMSAWSRLRPDLFQTVNISAASEQPSRQPGSRRTVIAYSGGLDATYALHAHKKKLLGRRTIDIQAAVLVHGFDIPPDEQPAFDLARGHAAAIVESYGVPLTVVRTNWKRHFSVDWSMTHVLGIASVLCQFSGEFGGGLLADDFPYEFQLMPWSNNVMTNQMLGCTAFPIRSTGAERFRTEKAMAIGENPVVLQHLRVCHQKNALGRNCGECEKCIRTKLNFYALGISPVTSLGANLSLEDVLSLRPKNAKDLHFCSDVLSGGRWGPNDPIHNALATLVADAPYSLERAIHCHNPPATILKRLEKAVRSWKYRFS
jgi:7-cyano-7-deazaguanine synthase in queuosine biosynthesis